MRFETVQEIYEVFARDRPTEWWMTEEEYLDNMMRFAVREPIQRAYCRRGGKGEDPIVIVPAVYWPDEHYREQWREHLRTGTAMMLGLPIRIADA